MFLVPLRIDYRCDPVLFLPDRVGCKEASIIATLMRSIAHQCASRQDPPLSNGQLPSQSWMMPRDKDSVYPFLYPFPIGWLLPCRATVSTTGSFLVSSSNLISPLHLLTGNDKPTKLISFDLLLLHFSSFFYVVSLTQLKLSPLFSTYTCTPFGIADYWFETLLWL